MRQAFVITAALFLLAACGSDLKPLNDTQKGILRDTATSVSRVGHSATDLKSSTKAATPNVQDATSATGTAPQGQDAIEKEMLQSLSGEKCQPTLPDLSNLAKGAAAFPLDLKFGMNGSSCPALINAEAKLNGSIQDLTADFSLSYQVQPQAKFYLNFNDVSALDLVGTGAFSLGLDGQSLKAEVHVNTRGTITSQKEGQIKTWIVGGFTQSEDSSGNQSQTGKLTADFWYPNFRAELVANFGSGNNGQPDITLNGEPITWDEFMTYFGADGLSSASLPSNLTGGGSSSQSVPSLGPSSVSLHDELRARIQNFVQAY